MKTIPPVEVGHHVLYKGQNGDGETITRPAVVVKHLGLGVVHLNVQCLPGDGHGGLTVHKANVSYGSGDHTWKCGPEPLKKDVNDEGSGDPAGGDDQP
jgi:hypothetical protein